MEGLSIAGKKVELAGLARLPAFCISMKAADINGMRWEWMRKKDTFSNSEKIFASQCFVVFKRLRRKTLEEALSRLGKGGQ